MWITSRGLMQETVIDPHTGLEKVVSVKCKGTSEKAKQEAYRRLKNKIEKMGETDLLFSKAIDLYIKEVSTTLKPSTWTRNKRVLVCINSLIGDPYLSAMSAGYVREKFINSGKSNTTLNGYIRIFKIFWKWAYRNDYVKSLDICDKLTRFKEDSERIKIQDKYLEPYELKTLLDGMNDRYWMLLTKFLALTGLRIGELIALNKTDVWGKFIRVTKTYDAANKVITSTKTASSKREVYIQPELAQVIKDINEETAKREEIFDYKSNLFASCPSGYIQYYSYEKYLRENAERLLNRKISSHVLRHTHCSMLFAKGVPLEAVSARLGHYDSKITKAIYLHKLEEQKEKENKLLDSITLLA